MSANDDPGRPDGRRRRWQQHNQARRQVIIDAAIAVLERHRPGEEVQVQAVADQAHLSRTVIYRHFEDRTDLDRAVQRQVCEDLGACLVQALALEGTPEQIVKRVVGAFVEWTARHPTLFWFAERELPGGPSPFAEAVESLASQIEAIMDSVVRAMGVELSAEDRAGLDPWVFGLIGAASSTIRRWLNRAVREPGAEAFTTMVAETLWVQIDAMARSRGIHLPDVPVDQLVGMLRADEE